MEFLEELFEVYKHTNKIKAKMPNLLDNKQLKFGDVIEIYIDNRLLMAAAVDDDEAILMSEFWEFATHTDMIVCIEHPIANKWIIETDKRLYLTPIIKYKICSTLKDEDKKILKDVLKGQPMPAEKSGSKLPFNKKDPRYKFKLEELKKTMLVNEHLFFEEDAVVIPFDFKSNLFKVERKAAADEKKLFEKNGARVLIKNSKEIIIDVGDKNIGRSIKIYLAQEKPIVLFKGIIEIPTFVIVSNNIIKNPYSIIDLLNIEIYDDKP